MVKVHSIQGTDRQQAPALTWVPVTGPDGRVHMEMRWHVAARAAGAARSRHAA